MSRSSTISRRTSKSQRRTRKGGRKGRAKPQRLLPFALIAAGALLLVGILGYLFLRPGAGAAAFDFESAKVAYDEPLHAVHEMDMPGMNMSKPIPFLPADGPQPVMLIPTTFYDFGSIGPTEVVTKEFIIANVGDAPLTISRAYTTCGCTTADFTSAVIPPGEISIVTLRLDAGFHDVRGQTVRRGLIIENNDPKNSNVEIWVRASVRAQP
ncbi:MAG: DUF1573 domain-containing protein [Chloroflexi bacterium]|nr:DUF1573 domain-containing protein [Chloroflexota bacterium]